jgi:hypothetical protein
MTTTWDPAVHTPRHRAPEVYRVRIAAPAELTRPGRHAAAEDADRHPGHDGDLLDWLGFASDVH